MRWAELFAQLGEEVTIVTRYAGEDADAMVAIHAWRSAASIESFAAAHPGRPLIVLLAGTDLYRDLESHRDVVLRSLDLADLIVGLHDLVGEPLEPRHRAKLAVIYQSALPPTHAAPPLDDAFEVLVVGHLRAEKDPLRAARAARLLPAVSRIQIEHLGRAHDAEWASRAEAEMAGNPRYRWRGEVGREEIGTRLGRARLMVLSSLMEGGANVISVGARRRPARPGLGHPRLDRPARPRLRRLVSGRRRDGPGSPHDAGRDGARLPRPSRGAMRRPRAAVRPRARARGAGRSARQGDGVEGEERRLKRERPARRRGPSDGRRPSGDHPMWVVMAFCSM